MFGYFPYVLVIVLGVYLLFCCDRLLFGFDVCVLCLLWIAVACLFACG